MRKIIVSFLAVFMLFNAGRVLALTPPLNCSSDRDCGSGYRCVVSEGTVGKSPKGYCVKIMVPTLACKNLWWFDASTNICSQKQFCGTYMYQGLRTFTTSTECKNNLPKTNCSMKKCGDANCDNKINSQDLIVWMRERAGNGKITADFNNDRKVDVKDYDILRKGIIGGCKGIITPVPTKPVITQIPAYNCSMLYNKSIGGDQNYFKMCLSNGYPKVCFDKYTGVYQGCGTLERDDCTEYNTNAARNIRCDATVAAITAVPSPTVKCVQACPNLNQKNLLQNCTPPDADGTSNDSLCSMAGRVESCGGRNYCCPAIGAAWTTDMTKCLTTPPTPGACGSISYINYLEACGVGISGEKTYRYVEYRCGSSGILKMGGPTSCKSVSTWKSYVSSDCLSRCNLPTPHLITPTPGLTTVNWKTQWANFGASNYQIQVADGTQNGRIFKVNPSKPCNMMTGEMICINSNPPYLRENGQHYMSLEVTWFEYDIEMRMFIYLYSDGKRWWSNEIRVYNGQAQPNTEWVYFYGKFFDTPIGQDFVQTTQFSLTAADPKNGNTPVTMKFSNVRFGAFKNYFPQIVTPMPSGRLTPTPVKTCETDKDCLSGQICYQPPMTPCPSGAYCAQVLPRKYCKTVTITPTPRICKEGVNSFSVNTSCGTGMFRYATYACYDGLVGKLGSATSCKSSSEYSIQAQKMCVGHGSCSTPPSPPPILECNMSINPPKLCPSGYKCISRSDMPGSNGTCVKVIMTPMPTGGLGCNRNGDADGDGKATLKDYAIWKFEYATGKISKTDFDCNKRVDLNDYQVWKKAFLLSKSLVVNSTN